MTKLVFLSIGGFMLLSAPSGGHAQDGLGSVFATLAQQASNTLSFFSNIVRSPADQRPRLMRQLLPAPSTQPVNAWYERQTDIGSTSTPWHPSNRECQKGNHSYYLDTAANLLPCHVTSPSKS